MAASDTEVIFLKLNKILSFCNSLVTALFLLTASIAMPILVRPFYYLQIRPLKLPEQTGLSVPQIKEAYNQMLDFCIGLREEFSVGVLQFSDSGRDHFADVRILFELDLVVLLLSAVLLLLFFCLKKAGKFTPVRFCGRGTGFWAATGLLLVLLVVGILVSLDFDRAFEIFHSIFFPGKTNWLFDPEIDQVITILPEVFFRNCAILIGGTLLLGCVFCIGRDFKRTK